MICIYGMGQYGVEFYYRLKANGIFINFFVDRDERKVGYALEEKSCISINELLGYDKQKTIIIIGIKNNVEKLKKFFKEQRFTFVYSMEEATNIFSLKKVEISHVPANRLFDLISTRQKFYEALYGHERKDFFDCELQNILDDYKKRNKINESFRSEL